MLRLPNRFAAVILAFSPLFVQQRTWEHAQLLLLGALRVPGQRTVCRILRVGGPAPGAALYPPPAHLSVTWKPAK